MNNRWIHFSISAALGKQILEIKDIHFYPLIGQIHQPEGTSIRTETLNRNYRYVR